MTVAIPEPNDPEWQALVEIIGEIRESQLRVESMVVSVSERVEPVLEAIAQSPLGSMLGI